jgi:cytochrome b pre-mRNA-processing protein 3
MKDLEKIFYGNVVAYDSAMLPEAKSDELANIIWRLHLNYDLVLT